MALVASTPEQRKTMPCLKIRDGAACSAGASCQYSHDPKVIEEAREKKAAKEKEKEKDKTAANAKAKRDPSKQKQGNKSGKKGVCRFYNSPKGCQQGSRCERVPPRGPGDGG